MAAFIAYLGMLAGAVGIFLGFYFLADDPTFSLRIVTGTTVGAVGILAFLRHVLFYRSDAARMGWQTDRPDWMFEVGFANLGFGVMGVLAAVLPIGSEGQSLVVAGYALYLLQAALLHGYRYFNDPVKSPARLWRSCIATLLYAAAMAFFALIGFSRPQL